jgi:hypothetical protein
VVQISGKGIKNVRVEMHSPGPTRRPSNGDKTVSRLSQQKPSVTDTSGSRCARKFPVVAGLGSGE